MSLTFTTANAILKEDYKQPLTDQLNQNFFILTQIEKNTDDVSGKRAVHPIHVSRSSGVGARSSSGALPTASNQGYVSTNIPMRYNYGRIQVGGPLIKAMAKDKTSFLRAIKSEMDGIVNDAKKDINRQLWGTSNGVIATCGTTSGSVTVQLAATTTSVQMRQVYNDGGMLVDIGTVAAPTTRTTTSRSVTAYDTTNLTITISGATITTAGTDFVFRAGAGGATDNTGVDGDGQVELTGLQTIVAASGYLHTVTAATYPVWAARVNTAGSNRSVSENLVNKEIQESEINSGVQVDLLLCNSGVSRAIGNTMVTMRRNNDTVALKAGYSGIRWETAGEYDGPGARPKAVKIEKDCPSNALYGIGTDSLVGYEMSDWEWMDMDGNVLQRVIGYDAYEAVFYKYMELACKQRNVNFQINALTEA